MKPTPSTLTFQSKLPFLAQPLNLSPNYEDYFMFPVPIMYTDLPNRNGFAFPLKELAAWNVEQKCQAYETWRYAPMFEEHRSEDITKSIGVVADVALTRIEGYGKGKLWKVMALAAIDRTKNKELANKIESSDRNTYSMGAMVATWSCSFCGAESGKCNHIDATKETPTLYELDGQLVFKNVHGITGFELSSVADPAFVTAVSDAMLTFR